MNYFKIEFLCPYCNSKTEKVIHNDKEIKGYWLNAMKWQHYKKCKMIPRKI